MLFPGNLIKGGKLTTAYRHLVIQLHQSLSIAPDYIDSCVMPLQTEELNLCNSGPDMFGREQRMTAYAFEHWQAMQAAALEDNIELLLVSAFRSAEYQCEIIRNKLLQGQNLDDILKVNAAPGFSEHHTGRALDLSTTNTEPLSEEFEHTEAFHWLEHHAKDFDFHMSFPRDNPFGIIYEPWHWACKR